MDNRIKEDAESLIKRLIEEGIINEGVAA